MKKKRNTYILCLTVLLAFLTTSLWGQRQTENLDRGIVAMPKSSSQIFISWRHFATDPDETAYNLYYKTTEDGALTKLNDTLITNSTNYLADLSTANSDYIFVVKSVLNGVEKDEAGSFTVPKDQEASRVVKEISFAPTPAGYAKRAVTKYIWVGDLNGDGKYDYVCSRHGSAIADDEDSTSTSEDSVETNGPFVEAYSSEGEFMWRIFMGKNVPSFCSGHADQLTVYDMDGDGYAEVLLTASEGTQFADSTQIKNADGTVHDYSVSGMSTQPQWMAILDGRTGNLIDTLKVPNFSSFYSTSSAKHISGHFMIQYVDGIHPSLTYVHKNDVAGAVWSIGYESGHLKTNYVRFSSSTEMARAGHQVRVGDTDGDGKDEWVEVSYVIDDDGTQLAFPSDNIKHGDRHCLADINPDRPGLECFQIQQSSIMGMGLFDPKTSEVIKGNYLSSIGDVGRGCCMAGSSSVRGMQYWSTIGDGELYDCKGELIEGSDGTFPNEPLWFGPELVRWHCCSPGNGGRSLAFDKINPETNTMSRVTPNFYSSAGVKNYRAYGNGRAQFWGDILGDWREELILVKSDTTGFGIISTWDVTDKRIYCLAQNPAYRCQITGKGYYETADVDFYMAWDMVPPPIAPIQTADEYITSESTLTSAVNDKSIMFDIRNPNTTITLSENVSPSRLWLMNPEGHDYTFTGKGIFTGSMDVVKSMQGTDTLNGDYTYTGNTRISEGKLVVNGSLASQVVVDARGCIAGNASLNGGITLNEGLNYAGGRIEPDGKITIAGDVSGGGRNTFAFDVDSTGTSNDTLAITGNFNVTGTDNFLEVNFANDKVLAGTYTLITYTGTSNASSSNFTIRGFSGKPYSIVVDSNKLVLEIATTRSADSVVWSGNADSTWNYESINFRTVDGESFFVPNDTVVFNDDATNKNVVIASDQMAPTNTYFANNSGTYTLSGTGGIGGTGFLRKEGTGTLEITTVNNTYTGATQILGGTVVATTVQNAGVESSLGEGSELVLSNATLHLTGSSATDRAITLGGDTAVLNLDEDASIYISDSIGGENTNFVKEGTGFIAFNSGNTFKSSTLREGRITLSSIVTNRTGFGSGSIIFEGDSIVDIPVIAMKDNNSDSNTGTPFSNAIVVPEGKIGRINFPMRWKVSSNLTGAGRFQVYVPYIRCDFRGNWNNFMGTIDILADSDGGDYRINNDSSYSKATVELGAHASFYHVTSGKTIKVGALASAVSSSKLAGSSTTWQIGGKNISTTFAGIISGSGSKLEKVGTGTLTLTGTNTYTGYTTVKEGTLVAAASSSLGTGTVTVNSGAELSTVNSECDTLQIGGGFTLGENATLTIEVNPATSICDIVNIAKDAVLNGILNLVKLGNTDFSVGDSFTIFNAQEGITGSLTLPTLSNGLKWDSSKLYSDGIISIAEIASIRTGINNTQEGKNILSIEYFDIMGQKINTPEATNAVQNGGAFIKKIIYSDGSVEVLKNVYK